jgi:hypothetical protein
MLCSLVTTSLLLLSFPLFSAAVAGGVIGIWGERRRRRRERDDRRKGELNWITHPDEHDPAVIPLIVKWLCLTR